MYHLLLAFTTVIRFLLLFYLLFLIVFNFFISFLLLTSVPIVCYNYKFMPAGEMQNI